MGGGELSGNRASESETPIATVRQQSEATIRLTRAERERDTLARLRATLPPLDPITCERATVDEAPPSRATPHTIVLPTASRPDRATLTMLRGPGGGRTFTLDRRETIVGRGSTATIVLDEPSVSREHARFTIDGDGGYSVEDLRSTNGTFVGGRPIRRARLETGDRVQIGSEYTFRFAVLDADEENLQRKLYESSTRDVLTGLMNRSALFDELARAIDRAQRERSDMAVLMIDADHFKEVNDRFGHAAGDEVLRAIALVGMRVLGEGVFARYGGEEFAAVARAGGRGEAKELAERLRNAVRDLRVEVGGGAVVVSVSIGVALLSECEIVDGLELFARADVRLYAAKLAGRDCVCADG